MTQPIDPATIFTAEAFGIPTIFLSQPDPIEIVLANSLLECLQGALESRPNPPAVFCLRTGAEVQLGISIFEDECRCGTAWVRPSSFIPSLEFPTQDEAWTPCNPEQWAIGLEMGVARCAEWGTAEELPTCTQWTDLTRQIAFDRQAMTAAACCFNELLPALLKEPNPPTILRPWEQRTIEGMCAGSSMEILVGVTGHSCC